ncbi:MAG: hypothetical protein RQ867_07955 [Mariprofundaceae bacterium]|nr:hypothetical protein [Mariprofundaceae bacterium]
MSETGQTAEQRARRRLLKMAGYVPPVLLGVMLLNRPAEAAPGCPTGGGGSVSAPAGSCCPCVPAATAYNPRRCCRDYCDPAACDAYAQSRGYNGWTCRRINGWCGTVPAGCNCCLDRRGRFVCRNPGRPCP